MNKDIEGTDLHYAFCGLKRTDRFTPSGFFLGSNDGIVRTVDGRTIADTGGNEVLTELIAVALNQYMDTLEAKRPTAPELRHGEIIAEQIADEDTEQ